MSTPPTLVMGHSTPFTSLGVVWLCTTEIRPDLDIGRPTTIQVKKYLPTNVWPRWGNRSVACVCPGD